MSSRGGPPGSTASGASRTGGAGRVVVAQGENSGVGAAAPVSAKPAAPTLDAAQLRRQQLEAFRASKAQPKGKPTSTAPSTASKSSAIAAPTTALRPSAPAPGTQSRAAGPSTQARPTSTMQRSSAMTPAARVASRQPQPMSVAAPRHLMANVGTSTRGSIRPFVEEQFQQPRPTAASVSSSGAALQASRTQQASRAAPAALVQQKRTAQQAALVAPIPHDDNRDLNRVGQDEEDEADYIESEMDFDDSRTKLRSSLQVDRPLFSPESADTWAEPMVTLSSASSSAPADVQDAQRAAKRFRAGEAERQEQEQLERVASNMLVSNLAFAPPSGEDAGVQVSIISLEAMEELAAAQREVRALHEARDQLEFQHSEAMVQEHDVRAGLQARISELTSQANNLARDVEAAEQRFANQVGLTQAADLRTHEAEFARSALEAEMAVVHERWQLLVHDLQVAEGTLRSVVQIAGIPRGEDGLAPAGLIVNWISQLVASGEHLEGIRLSLDEQLAQERHRSEVLEQSLMEAQSQLKYASLINKLHEEETQLATLNRNRPALRNVEPSRPSTRSKSKQVIHILKEQRPPTRSEMCAAFDNVDVPTVEPPQPTQSVPAVPVEEAIVPSSEEDTDSPTPMADAEDKPKKSSRRDVVVALGQANPLPAGEQATLVREASSLARECLALRMGNEILVEQKRELIVRHERQVQQLEQSFSERVAEVNGQMMGGLQLAMQRVNDLKAQLAVYQQRYPEVAERQDAGSDEAAV
ncbi:hypothetical protein CAOG_03373 [Capsaspora owczarzaki ATCC 30864]|uniref:Uncharacterized protein n=1 Tax=Capsaspora owczarzaki (strain ATCC 30864) TaxID=595528 RepID=A0A0D2WN02_CAPO3|nr:hypothetical protein CAOG_03373 [Capsaspora owczarzaki ATCC 30864]KJE92395.1 hypothetical protein CAOG_003373 [Capsaspora owczarzaki ATCC 30864]|eukprot:XP_004364212.1 hypothetical protein CAOG_03373 [Capsaspora owczarzaki ATCC 30864]